MGALKADGSVVPNGRNAQPAPLVEPLVTYWLATSDKEGLDFARAYAEGIINNLQPGGIRFQSNGAFNGHSHATMHAVWGIAHLGLITSQVSYVDFAQRAWNWMLTRGTGTGWFPAGPDDCNETCCLSDMMSIAALLGKSGHAEYYDYVERYLRNHIVTQQFIVTPAFVSYYHARNRSAGEDAIERGLADPQISGRTGGSGRTTWRMNCLGRFGIQDVQLLRAGRMRAIYTAWLHAIDRRPDSPAGPAGVYVNMNLNRESPWGTVLSFLPDEGRLTVRAAVRETFFVRPPHWASRTEVRAFRGTNRVPVNWVGHYVRFQAEPGDDLTITYPLLEFTHQVAGLWKGRPNLQLAYKWRGNMVVSVDPPAKGTPLFTGRPRLLPPAPDR
jgi:hypothetical protein